MTLQSPWADEIHSIDLEECQEIRCLVMLYCKEVILMTLLICFMRLNQNAHLSKAPRMPPQINQVSQFWLLRVRVWFPLLLLLWLHLRNAVGYSYSFLQLSSEHGLSPVPCLWNMLNISSKCSYTVELRLKVYFYYILVFSGVCTLTHELYSNTVTCACSELKKASKEFSRSVSQKWVSLRIAMLWKQPFLCTENLMGEGGRGKDYIQIRWYIKKHPQPEQSKTKRGEAYPFCTSLLGDQGDVGFISCIQKL